MALAPDKSAAVTGDADASEADHVDENLLQDLLLAFDVDKGAQFRPLCIGMESVWLRLSRATASVKSIRLGFLGPWPFRFEDPC